MKVLFIATGDIALPTLKFLAAHPGVELASAVTGQDKPVGRKQTPTPPVIKITARELGIPVSQPARIRDPAALAELAALEPDLIVVMAYGQILPKSLLDLPRLGCLNLHASLLPRHRGASPIQAALREGDSKTGITVMFMDEGLDTGDILLRRHIDIAPDETGGGLHDRLADLAPGTLAAALECLAAGPGVPRTPQIIDRATCCGKLGRENGRIDWSTPATRLERLIRAYHPWPGTYGLLVPAVDGADRSGGADAREPLRIKIFPPTRVVESMAVNGRTAVPGSILRMGPEGMLVATGSDALLVTRLQMAGKRKMDVGEFLAGRAIPPDSRWR